MSASDSSTFQQSIGELQRQISLQSQSSFSGSDTDPLVVLPPELVLQLFEYVALPEVLCTCRLVCKGWQQFFSDRQFWQLRMMQGRNFDQRLMTVPNVNWPQLCISTVYRPNLIQSFVDGDLSLVPWKISYVSWEQFKEKQRDKEEEPADHRRGRGRYWGAHGYHGGGDKWSVEETISAQDPRNAGVFKENGGSSKNYVTSYEWCCREQVVELAEFGFLPQILDQLQPTIAVSEWFCAREDCGSIFQIRVDLLDENRRSIQRFETTRRTERGGGQLGWRKVEHLFRGYGAGVRYIRFADAGKDTKWWAGHYGSKMAAAWVRVRFSD